MNEMQVFKYKDNEVRTVEQGGEVWWVLADVCRVLALSEPHRVAHRLDEDEKGRTQITTLGGDQKMTIISESGLYKVILRSDKPEAKKFTRWVTHEVLPTIRRTGGYGSQAAGLTKLAEQMAQTATAIVQVASAAPLPWRLNWTAPVRPITAPPGASWRAFPRNLYVRWKRCWPRCRNSRTSISA